MAIARTTTASIPQSLDPIQTMTCAIDPHSTSGENLLFQDCQCPHRISQHWLTLFNRSLAKPPYHRRRSHNRRPSPTRNSPGLPVTATLTPINPTFISARRTSLPALHFHETVKNVVHLDTRTAPRRDSLSEDMYRNLQTFKFGAPPCHTTRESGDEDEDERQRRRAKMRAIDDGTRRPSLPTNSATPTPPRSQPSLSSVASSAGIVVGERQWDEHSEPDWDIVMGDTTPTKSSPPPPTPSPANTGNQGESRRPSVPIAIPMLRRRSRSADELAVDFDLRMRGTTPTPLPLTPTPLFSWVKRRHSRDDNRGASSSPEENAYDGFDLEFILSKDAAAGAEVDPSFGSSSRRRPRFFKTMNPHPQCAEDTFNRHILQSDPVYQRRKAEWSFRREVRPGHQTSSAKGKDRDRSGKLVDELERWRCEWVGRFTVVKIRSDKPPLNISGTFYAFLPLTLTHVARRRHTADI